MKLNHINLPVTDVAESRNFFEQYFDFKCIDIKGNDMLAVLEGTDGFTLVLMANSFNRNGNTTYPDAFHIGFLVDTPEEVMRVHEKLKTGGFAADQTPGNIRGGFGFYFNAPGNILTEITCYK